MTGFLSTYRLDCYKLWGNLKRLSEKWFDSQNFRFKLNSVLKSEFCIETKLWHRFYYTICTGAWFAGRKLAAFSVVSLLQPYTAKLQPLGVQLSGILVSLGIMGGPLKPLKHHSTMVSRGLREVLHIAPPLCREASVSRRIGANVSSLGTMERKPCGSCFHGWWFSSRYLIN